ncbi:hypothetical protein AOC05_04960 [Arthrobacter alpinus]|uniref:Uncharacterized protein n=1 Tax=Arthrobacter alpinus TaxID=656366 RepID=A0A0M4QVN0_9MICC|nr:hypothetical protein AOC05_04960 [Arthrobacter alpinus]
MRDPTEFLLRGREAAEFLMFETCTASRPGVPFTDPDGIVTSPLSTVYTGICKVQATVAQAASPVAGGHAFTVENLQLHFPVGSGVVTGDSALITSSRMDESNVGLAFRLVELARGSQRTAARWNVELVTA